MAPKLKRVSAEDFSDAPEWFRRFIDLLNPFLGDTTSSFAAANTKRQVETFRLDTGATVSDSFSSSKLSIKNRLQTKPSSVHVGQIYSRSSTGVLEDAWHTPTFLNSWVNFGGAYGSAQYMKDSLGFVHTRGMIKTGTIGAAAFVLPAGYRPPSSAAFSASSNSAFALINVLSTGDVKPDVGSNVSMSLEGITFRADDSTAPAVVWELLQNGLIRINYIPGLAPSKSYEITLIVE